MSTSDRIDFIQNGENIDEEVLNRPSRDLADEFDRVGLVDAIKKQATLSLDFANNKHRLYEVDGGMTWQPHEEILDFNRTSEATYFDATGVLRTAAVDEPRFTYDPETGEAQGLLIEEQRTNLMPYSNDLTQGDWTANSASLSVGSDPKSTKPVSTITTLGQGSYEGVYYSSNIFPSVNDTSRFIVARISDPSYKVRLTTRRDASPSGYFIEYDLASGSIIDSNTATGDILPLGDGWWLLRHNLSRSVDSLTTLSVGLYVIGDSPAGVELQVANIDCFDGLVDASSPIFTNGTEVTRAADDCSRTLGAEFNPNEGVFYWEGVVTSAGSVFYVQSTSANNNADSLLVRSDVVAALFGTTKVTLSLGGVGTGSMRLAVSYNGAFLSFFLNGQQVGTPKAYPSGHTSLSFLNRVDLGKRKDGRDPSIGTHGMFLHIPRALTAAELEALTAPD